MIRKKVAEPDYDFKMETLQGSRFVDKVFFSSEVFIFKCTKGRALISINTEEHEFSSDTNFLLAEGRIFKILECSLDFTLQFFRFSLNFFNVIYPMLPGKTAEVIAYSVPDLYSKEDMEMSNLIFMQLSVLYHRKDHTWRHKIAVNLILNYILEIYEQTYKYVQDKMPAVPDYRTFLIDRFYGLCIEEHTRHRNIEYYAERLSITSRYLYKICKESVQLTPKQCIDYMVSGTAKKLVLTTNQTNQQIAHELNFPDQTTFGQFFKRTVGMSPSEFRSKFR